MDRKQSQIKMNMDEAEKPATQHILCHKRVELKEKEELQKPMMKNPAQYMDRKQSQIKMNMDEAAAQWLIQ